MANLATQQDAAVRVVPAVDIYESEKDYLLVVDVPGIETNGIEIELDKGLLKVAAKRVDGAEAVTYSREFKVPSDVHADSVSANAKDGVLRLVLPKHESALPKRIAVANA
jgi:HSP20 family protein